MTKDTILIGAGGHACVLLDILKKLGVRVRGYVNPKKATLDLEYLGDDDYLTPNLSHQFELINTIGSISIPHKRKKVYLYYKGIGFKFKTLIHPSAIISNNVQISEGTQIMAGAILQPEVIIGQNSIINTGVTIDHHSIIGEHVHITPGTTICGNANIGDLCHVGPNSTIIQGIIIKKETFVPAHTLIKEHL